MSVDLICPATQTPTHTAGQVCALFASPLQPSDHPNRRQVASAIIYSLRCNGNEAGCTAKMAQEYGDHPEEARARMRWALGLLA